jgi:hypothetical protein
MMVIVDDTLELIDTPFDYDEECVDCDDDLMMLMAAFEMLMQQIKQEENEYILYA